MKFTIATSVSFQGENAALRYYWLRDTSNDPEDELTEPEAIAAAIAIHLGNALRETGRMMDEFTIAGETP